MKIKQILADAFDIHDDSASHKIIKERIESSGQVTGTNMCVMVLAVLIASIGLNMNSTAVIIGAMLISPLMGNILTVAYSTASADKVLFRKSILGFSFQIIFCLLASTIYFCISPISSETNELLARTQPTIWDVLIALCGGFAGIIGITRKDKANNIIPGVAIATALMPPLCTCGFGIATGNLRFILGALYLFIMNCYFIFLASTIILFILKVPTTSSMSPKRRKVLRFKLVRNTIVMIIPSLIFAAGLVSSQKTAPVTGFSEIHVNEVSVVEQMNILFPKIKDSKFSETTDYDANGNKTGTHYQITVSSDEKLDATVMDTLDKWLDSVYGTDCTVVQAE